MAGEDREGAGSLGGGSPDAGRAADSGADGSPQQPRPLDLPKQSPLYHAEHADRYARQELIEQYQDRFDCRLIVVKDVIIPNSIVLLEELLYDADPVRPLHLMLDSPGGDGETAVRMVRSAQDRTAELTVIVPNQAKSAATILAMGAHRILMGPTSDLGPVDPQFQFPDGRLWSAKDILAAVNAAEEAIAANPDTYPLHATLLSQVDALLVQRARSALERTEDVVAEALRSHPGRTEEVVQTLKEQVRVPLIDLPKSHGAVFGVEDADKAGLPAVRIDHRSDQWKLIWRLYTKYALLPYDCRAYEGERASRILFRDQG